MIPKTAVLCLAMLLPVALTVRGDDPEPKARAVKPREIVAAGLPAVGGGGLDAPTSIPNEKRLLELVADKEARATILKQVDFRKEQLLLFSWPGSGGDRLTPVEGEPRGAKFAFTAGETDDEFFHVKLFAVPARAKAVVARMR